jgi:hypothetical protein
VEVKVAIEVGRPFIDRIDDDGTSPKLSSPSHATPESVDEQVTAEVMSLFVAVDGKACEQDNRHRVGHSTPKPRGRTVMVDCAHGKGVVTDDAPPPSNHIGSSGARSLGHSCAVMKPTVEFDRPGIEPIDDMDLGQQLDGTERLGSHLDGIGLGSLA